MESFLHTFLFTEKASLDLPATMIRTNDHVRIDDRIYWVLNEPTLPRPFIRTEEKERGWLFYAIEIKDTKALEIIKEKGVFTDLNSAQVENLSVSNPLQTVLSTSTPTSN